MVAILGCIHIVRTQRTGRHYPGSAFLGRSIPNVYDFGTFKQKLDRIATVDEHDLRVKLVEFRAWYNHARPHQHLGGHTPAEVWCGRPKSTKPPRFVSIWGGFITGWFFPP